MKNLIELFNQKDFSVCKAQKTELGFKTERFNLETPQEAFEWLKECESNSIKFIHNLWGDEPTKIEMQSINDDIVVETI